MLKWTARVLLPCGLALAASVPARAQAWEDRAYINVNFGLHLTASPATESLAPVIYDERASVVTSRRLDRGVMPLDVGVGVRVWKGFGLGGAFTQFSSTESATLDASVPHPILFRQPRFTSVPVPLAHSEMVLHALALYVMPLTERMDVTLFGGPSLLTVKQDRVSGIQVVEESPTFTTVTVAKTVVATTTDRSWAAGGGADVTYFLTPLVGVGATVRYTSATGGGGLQVGAGARIRLR